MEANRRVALRARKAPSALTIDHDHVAPRTRLRPRTAPDYRTVPPIRSSARTRPTGTNATASPAEHPADDMDAGLRATKLRGLHSLPYDLLHWPSSAAATAGTSPLVILFVPGNPGLVAWYIHFLSSLRSHLPPSTTLYALGHLGHSAGTPYSAPVATLIEQVAHKVQFIDDLSSQQPRGFGTGPGQTRLVLLGHSIGCWINCEVTKQRPALVSSVHHFFPTLSHMAATSNGVKLSPLFRLPLFPLGLTTGLLAYVPPSILHPVVSILSRQTSGPAHTTTSLVQSPGTVRAAITMAREEFAVVRSLDAVGLEEYGDRMWFYWAEGEKDEWVRDSSVKEIIGVLKRREGAEEQARWMRDQEGMGHAFCLIDGESISSRALNVD